MSRSAKAAKGFATSIFRSLSQILIQIFLAPIVLKMAGREALGAYAAIMQMVSLLLLVDIAGSWSLERFLGHALAAEDQGQRFRDVFTTARTILLITNTIFGIGVFVMSLFIGRLFHLSPDIQLQARHALYVVALWGILRTPLAAYMNGSIATQDLAVTNIISTVISVSRTLASLLFVLAGTGLFGLIISGTVVEIIGCFLYRARFRKMSPNLEPGWGIPDRALFREMLGFGGYVLLTNVGNRLFFNSANMMAALTNGAAEASAFYTSQMPTMTGYVMLMRIADNTAPAVYELTGKGENERLRKAFLRLTHIVMVMTLPLAIGVILFNRDVVVCWVGTNEYAGTLLSITLAIFCVLDGIRAIAVLFAFAQGWMRLLTATSLVQGLANFGLGYVFGKWLGLGGVTLSLCVVMLPQFLILLWKVERTFSIGIASHLIRNLLRLVIPLVAAAFAGEFIHFRIKIALHHFPGLLFECFVFLVVYSALAYPLALEPQDREDVHRVLSSAINLGRRAVRIT